VSFGVCGRVAAGEHMTASLRAASTSFPDWLARRQADEPARRKGERTRDRIRLVTAALLNEVGYRELKVSDICARAEVTTPVLYQYFETKQALTIEVLREFLDQFLARTDLPRGTTAYASMLDANRRWIALARSNAGLLQCLLDLSVDEPAFATLFVQASDTWYQRVARSIVRRFPSAAADAAAIELIAHAMGAMMDEVTRKLVTGRRSRLQTLVATVAPTDGAMAEFLTVLWYRALYAASPDDTDTTVRVAPTVVAAARRQAQRRSAR
jgi:TetR/AcrR family transcriptional regulator, transcriptional repressor for nem operon